MKIVHTADWHLGRCFKERSLLPDQKHVLEQVVGIVERERPGAVLIAGDVYDRPVPPAEAVALLDATLTRLAATGAHIFLIAGNHDSPDRIGFGAGLLRDTLHLAGPLAAEPRCVVLADADGPVHVVLLPFPEIQRFREETGSEARTHEDVLRALTARARAAIPPGARSVLITHAFVTGGTATAESERPLLVGGAGEVDGSVFAGFSYVALGHLHRPQTLHPRPLHYAGSLLKYSFNELDHAKSVTLVDLRADGTVTRTRLPLTPLHDLRRIAGTIDELLATPNAPCDDYLEVELTDAGLVLDAQGRLRQVYPNVLHICHRLPRVTAAPRAAPGAAGRRISEIFDDFYRQCTGEELTAEERAVLREIEADLARAEEAEAVPA